MRLFVDLCHLLAALCVAPFLLYRSWRTGKYRTDWDQRRGWMPDLPPASPDHPRVWVHAVSVGETNAVRGLITTWKKHSPQTEFILSCTTDTGIARARELFPDLTVIRYPLDFSPFIRRALDRIKPHLIVLVELEVWFHFTTMAKERGIPVAVVNGRLSEKSTRLFSKIRPVARRMFGALAWVGAQDEAYAQRFRRLGVPADRVSVTGSLKWETAQIGDSIPGAMELARAMGIQIEPAAQVEDPPLRTTPPIEPEAQARVSSEELAMARNAPAPSTRNFPIWVCGSTGPGEEEIILDVLRSFRKPADALEHMQLVIVPRKPERFDEVASLIERAGFVCVRRTQCPDGTARSYDERAVQLVDTMGELRKVYSLADVVFVGRSLVPMGGSDMMEVAALAKPIIVGPHTKNFADAMQQLLEAGAISVVPVDASKGVQAVMCLMACVDVALDDTEKGAEAGLRAREVVRKNLGATQRTLDRLLSLVQRPPSA